MNDAHIRDTREYKALLRDFIAQNGHEPGDFNIPNLMHQAQVNREEVVRNQLDRIEAMLEKLLENPPQ